MRILTTLTALIIGSSTLFAQKIEWSELSKVTGRLMYILPVEGSSFYTYRWSGGALLGSPNLARHENFTAITQEKIAAKVEGSSASIEDIMSLDGKVIVFLSDRQEGQNKLFMQEYGSDCLPQGAPRELAEYTIPKGWNRSSSFSVLQSDNQDFFCVEYSIPGKNEEHDRFGFKVMNADYEIVSEGEYESPYEARESAISNRYISNTGDYFLAVKVYNLNEKGKVKDYSSLDKFVLMQVTADGVEEMELELGDKNISEVTFSSDNNRLMTFNGLYGQGSYSAKGVFYFQVDFRKKEILNEGFNEFAKDFITEGWSDRAKAKADKREAKGKGTPELYNYETRDNITLPDGSMIGLIEQYYVRVVTTTDSKGNTRTTYYYYYNDVIAYRVSQTGEFDWVKKIPKRQVSTNDGGYLSSIATYITGDRLVMMFNDNLKNYDEAGDFIATDDVEYASYRKKTNCVARVELALESGEMERKTFFGRGEAEAIAVPKLFVTDYKNNQMLIVLQIMKKEKYGLINFGD
jgi:hypothetical protein